ncbi:MAG: metallophosphoesterase [Chitinophagaceae bacterium]|jgi:acid phosphatase type 7|nr:metallophosphoesterase [Chitinophagaceae bacterium]
MKDKKPFSFSRRQFIDTAVKVSAVGGLAYIQMSGCGNEENEITPPPENKHVFLCKPYLHTLQHRQMCVRWITNKSSYSWVEYGDTEQLNQKAMHIEDGLVTTHERIHEIYLQNLEPGKTYYYRAASKEITEYNSLKTPFGETIYSSTYSFTTPDPAAREISWLVLNDLHDRPESFSELMELNSKDPYDFVFLNGDMFNYQSGEKQILEHLLIPCTDLFATQKPLLFVRGNHETRGNFAQRLKDYFAYPEGLFFHFHWGPVFAIVLDTGEDKGDDHPTYAGRANFNAYRREQTVWLEQLMQTDAYKNATYRVVMMHIPPFYCNQPSGEGEMHCNELFAPLFNQYKVDLVISGHTHKYGVHPPVSGKHNYPVIIGGGPKDNERTLMKIKANEKTLTVQMINDVNKPAGSYTIYA